MHKGHLFVVSGPSGSGKGTLISRLMDVLPSAWVSVSATTRPPRDGEIEGKDYFFKTQDEFEDLIANNGLLEYATYAGNFYGTPRRSVEEHMCNGEHVILEIECKGAFQVRDQLPESNLIFIEPPSLEELQRRLKNRGTENDDVICERMKSAKVELKQKMEYDYIIVNDDVDSASAKLIDYINSIVGKPCVGKPCAETQVN